MTMLDRTATPIINDAAFTPTGVRVDHPIRLVLLGHVADLVFDLPAAGEKIKAEARSFAVIGFQQPAKHPDERGFSAAVRAEEPIDFALFDAECDVVDDGLSIEAFGHSAHVDRRVIDHREPLMTSTGCPG